MASTPPKPAPFAAKPASGGMNLTLILAIGGGVAAALILTCGVIGGVAYYQFSKPRAVAKMPPTFGAPPVQFSQQPNFRPPPGFGPPNGSYGPGAGPYTPPPSAPSPNRAQPITSGSGSTRAFPPAGMSTHTVPGLFSIAAPHGWEWTELDDKVFGGMPSREFRAKRTGTIGHIDVRLVDIPNASQDQRSGFVEGRTAQLKRLLNTDKSRLIEIKGLDYSGKIPDTVNYTYQFQVGTSRGYGSGKIIFSPKHSIMLNVTAGDLATYQSLKPALATFKEF